MVGATPGGLWYHPSEPELGKIEPVDERLDHPNRVVLVDIVLNARGSRTV